MMEEQQLFVVQEDHAVIPSRDWTKSGFYAKCKCGVWRCSVLIERGDIPRENKWPPSD